MLLRNSSKISFAKLMKIQLFNSFEILTFVRDYEIEQYSLSDKEKCLNAL
ncbi:hypothetical protein LV85_01879 [Algoriphagus chordae]|uniref:Uncharacterized protein n=1 Tax=Algoriphagus chordae TaxID=237019 RepID=A0A2W7RA93_9BACT|nr:hypothetical protein LV85_01879 [Algoriphagus chordae]